MFVLEKFDRVSSKQVSKLIQVVNHGIIIMMMKPYKNKTLSYTTKLRVKLLFNFWICSGYLAWRSRNGSFEVLDKFLFDNLLSMEENWTFLRIWIRASYHLLCGSNLAINDSFSFPAVKKLRFVKFPDSNMVF